MPENDVSQLHEITYGTSSVDSRIEQEKLWMCSQDTRKLLRHSVEEYIKEFGEPLNDFSKGHVEAFLVIEEFLRRLEEEKYEELRQSGKQHISRTQDNERLS